MESVIRPSSQTIDTDAPAKARKLSIFTMVLFAVVVLYSGIAVYSGTFLPIRLVRGTSMEPNLVAGDLIVLKNVPFSSLAVGDIIAYRTPDIARKSTGTPRAILHRIIDIESSSNGRVLTTKGDNSDPDPWPITEDIFRGMQVTRIPWVGKPVVFIMSPKGLIFLSIGTLITLLYFPAMMIFHMTVLKKPETSEETLVDESTAIARTDTPDLTSTPGTEFATTVQTLATEQHQIRGSLDELSNSINAYASNIGTQTEIVHNITGMTDMLKNMVLAQGGQGGHEAQSIMTGIMIVDDQAPFRKRARDVLEIEGDFHIVAEAGDGNEAIELMKDTQPDLVLMDVQMPGMNGFEATQLIHDSYPDTKVALISMDSDEEYDRMAHEIGAEGFIAKKDLSADSIRKTIASNDDDGETTS